MKKKTYQDGIKETEARYNERLLESNRVINDNVNLMIDALQKINTRQAQDYLFTKDRFQKGRK